MKFRSILLVSALTIAGIALGCAKDVSSPLTPDAPVVEPDGTDPAFANAYNSCEVSARANSYIGCDAWPTPVANVVWNVFDFAVVVANAGDKPASITVERAGKVITTARVEPNDLAKVFLPWVADLKGKDADLCGQVVSALPKSVRVNGGAYHLKSDRPVTVYQFNALEYAPVGGPSKKDWTACPGDLGCPGIKCFSYSNDASILFPTSGLTSTYRITGINSGKGNSYFAITATRDGTKVIVQLSATAHVLGGGGIPDTPGGGKLELTMNEGAVVELAAPIGEAADLSGSLVTADKPIQVIAGHPCTNIPSGVAACDHLEQSVLPAETLGKHYFLVPPTGPSGGVPGHVVRIYGNVDNTQLTYPQGAPSATAPKTIDAGQVVDLGVVDKDFEILGDHEFAAMSFMMGGQAVDPAGGEGDPSMSTVVAIEQYRQKYVFLAPDDYDTTYVDAYQPMDAVLSLDGKKIDAKPSPIGSSGFGVNRIRLASVETHGRHVLEASAPIGIQVVGYGLFTSFQYPGGLDLKRIAPAPR